ncbi:uncharacterized protein LOC128672103 [Plodia interpunctella]|uniref:uncharacterized protein LOC128672103 n=1 Tax=Plodia interpunctella TaxID=58824 RepID=UPI002367F754|nr:uncharacterized protein LOC128672103 [Plodia interpunctella]
MTKIGIFLVLLQYYLRFGVNGKFFHTRPCEAKSPGCLAKHIQAAMPAFTRGYDYGLNPLDPYPMNNFEVLLAGGLLMRINEGQARGLRKCTVDFARMVDDTLETQFHCNISFRGKYKSTGHLLMFSFNGDGDAKVKCMNLKIHNIMKLGTREDPSGRKFFVMKNSTTTHSYEGRVSYSLTNLLKGNPLAGKAVLQFMNDNWRIVAEEFGDPFVQYGVSMFIANVERLFDVVPQDRLVNADF